MLSMMPPIEQVEQLATSSVFEDNPIVFLLSSVVGAFILGCGAVLGVMKWGGMKSVRIDNYVKRDDHEADIASLKEDHEQALASLKQNCVEKSVHEKACQRVKKLTADLNDADKKHSELMRDNLHLQKAMEDGQLDGLAGEWLVDFPNGLSFNLKHAIFDISSEWEVPHDKVILRIKEKEGSISGTMIVDGDHLDVLNIKVDEQTKIMSFFMNTISGQCTDWELSLAGGKLEGSVEAKFSLGNTKVKSSRQHRICARRMTAS